jgi:hypothetical protein
MAPIVWTDVTTLPGATGDGLGAVDPVAQTAILAVVNKYLDVSSFDGESGPDTHLARCFMAAHICAMGKLGVGGPVTGESDGRRSRQYAMPSTRSELMRTSYGAAVVMLMGAAVRGPHVL